MLGSNESPKSKQKTTVDMMVGDYNYNTITTIDTPAANHRHKPLANDVMNCVSECDRVLISEMVS